MKTILTEGRLRLEAETELEEAALKMVMRRGEVRVVNGNHWENTNKVAAEFLLPEADWGT